MSDDVRSSEDLTEATASGLRWITAARFLTEILLLATMVLLARLIPPAAFGMFAIALLVQELAISISSEGVGTALVQRRRISRAHLEGGMAVGLAIASGFAVVTLVASVLVVRPVFGGGTATLVALAAPWFLISAAGAPSYSLLRRRLDFRKVSILDLTNSCVRASLSLTLALVGLDAGALVLGALAGVTTATVLGLIFAPVPLPRWRSQAIRELLSYGGPAALASVCWAGFRNGDYAIVGAKLGATQAGLYWRGFQLAVDYQRKISAVMTSVGFPVLARTAGTKELYALRKRMVRMLTLVVFPLLCCLVVLAPVAVPWIFGSDWQDAVLPTQILAGAGAATVVIDAVGTVLMATGRARAILGYGVAHFVVYVVAVLIGANWSLAGVSVAAVSTHLVFLVVAYQVLLRDPGWRPLKLLWDDISAATCACAALVAVAWPLSTALQDAGAPSFVHLAVVGAVSAVPYLAVLRLSFPDAWRDLSRVLMRVLPVRPLRAAVRRLPLAAGRSS